MTKSIQMLALAFGILLQTAAGMSAEREPEEVYLPNPGNRHLSSSHTAFWLKNIVGANERQGNTGILYEFVKEEDRSSRGDDSEEYWMAVTGARNFLAGRNYCYFGDERKIVDFEYKDEQGFYVRAVEPRIWDSVKVLDSSIEDGDGDRPSIVFELLINDEETETITVIHCRDYRYFNAG